MTDVFNVLMVGVGGQGVVLTSDILTAAAMHAGLDAKKSEIHGMSQRGGPVFSHVRFGDKVHSPVIAKGEADILFGLERMELVRWAEWGRPGAAACYVNKDLPPHGVGRYPDELNERIRSIFGTVISFAPEDLRKVKLSPKVINTVLLGAVSTLMTLPLEAYDVALEELVPKGTFEMNRAAFHFGRQLAGAQTASHTEDGASVG